MGLAKYCEEIVEKLLDDSERFYQEHQEAKQHEMQELATYKQERVRLAIKQVANQLLDLITDPKIEEELRKAEIHSKIKGFSNLDEAISQKERLNEELLIIRKNDEQRITELKWKVANTHTYYQQRIAVLEKKIESFKQKEKGSRHIHKLLEEDLKQLEDIGKKLK